MVDAVTSGPRAAAGAPPTVYVVVVRGRSGGADGPAAGAPNPQYMRSAAQPDGGAVPRQIRYDRDGRAVVEMTAWRGRVTSAITLGYNWLV